MSFDLGSLISPGTLLGTGIGFGISLLADKVLKKGGSAEFGSDIDQTKIAALQAKIDADRESQGKVDEVHAYARQLEEKIQQLESTSDSADSQLRVKVLEKQLSEKADLESKLAVALQQLEDYKAKAEMYDTVLGATPEPKPAPVFEPVVAAEPEVEPIFATELEPEAEAELIPAPEIESEMPAAFFEPEPAHEELAPVAIAQEMPPVSPAAVEVDSIAAVALAAEEEVPEMTVHENQGTIQGQASPVGSTAPAIDDRPALRVETNPIIDVKDPLEKIEGIGQVYQTKLYEAGIKTFAQLAAASPSRITEVVEPQNWQTIDIMKWRREAALYAAGEKS